MRIRLEHQGKIETKRKNFIKGILQHQYKNTMRHNMDMDPVLAASVAVYWHRSALLRPIPVKGRNPGHGACS